jgi:hypothetical protein
MLDLLDSILAFSAIILGVSLLILVIVQGITGFLNLRGMALADGLSELFLQAKFSGEDAKRLASKILTHPLISDSIVSRVTLLSRWVHASAIRKDELLRLLAQAEEFGILPDDVKSTLEEKKAALEKAVSVVGDWFDGQMDRVSQVFAFKARIVTIVVSFFVAFYLHLDAGNLLERAFTDSEARAKLVASVTHLEERAKELGVDQAGAAPRPAPSAPPTDDGAKQSPVVAAGNEPKPPPELKKTLDDIREIQAELGSSAIDVVPKFEGKLDLKNGFHVPGDYYPGHQKDAWRHLLGILAAGALLSLGAPFWFNLLRQLTNLRSVLATKEEAERKGKAQG